MSRADDILEKISLYEMPYVSIEGQDFDLELESIKSKEIFIDKIKKIFTTKVPIEDKYGGTIFLKNNKSKKAFKAILIDDLQLDYHLKKWKFPRKEFLTLLQQF